MNHNKVCLPPSLWIFLSFFVLTISLYRIIRGKADKRRKFKTLLNRESFGLNTLCCESFLRKSRTFFSTMESFSAEIWSRGYHVYRGYAWSNITLNQIVEVYKENSFDVSRSILLQDYCKKNWSNWSCYCRSHTKREISQTSFIYYKEEQLQERWRTLYQKSLPFPREVWRSNCYYIFLTPKKWSLRKCKNLRRNN